jgi:hypothetical protein
VSPSLSSANLPIRHNAKVSQKALQDYNEMIQDTAYNLKVQLQRVDEKMSRFTTDNASTLNSSVDLKNEREVTKQCLRICEDASHYIESLTNQESALLHEGPRNATQDDGQTASRHRRSRVRPWMRIEIVSQ